MIIAAIVVLWLIGSGVAVKAADSLLSLVETILIVTAITAGSLAVLGIGGWLTVRSISRARARERARAPLYAVQSVRVDRPTSRPAGLPAYRQGPAQPLSGRVWPSARQLPGRVPGEQLPAGRRKR